MWGGGGVCVVLFNSLFPRGSADQTCLALQPELTTKSQLKRQLSAPINQRAVRFCCSLSEEASVLCPWGALGMPPTSLTPAQNQSCPYTWAWGLTSLVGAAAQL